MLNGKKIINEAMNPPTSAYIMGLFTLTGFGAVLIALGIFFIILDRFL